MTTTSSWADAGASVSRTAKRLPARLRYARNETLGSELTESQARDLEPANECAAPASYLAAINHSRRAGVPWQLGKTGIILSRLELGPHGGVLLDRSAFTLISIDPGHLCHTGTRKIAEFTPFATRFAGLRTPPRGGRRGPYPDLLAACFQ